MSRITGTDAANLIDAYNSLYAPQEEVELTEEQVQEDFENWVNSLVEEGHDLSEYTWEDMYEYYLNEAPIRYSTGPTAADLQRQRAQASPRPAATGYNPAGGGMGGGRGSGSSPGGVRPTGTPRPAPGAGTASSRYNIQNLGPAQYAAFKGGGGLAAMERKGQTAGQVVAQGRANIGRFDGGPRIGSAPTPSAPARPAAPAARPSAPVAARPATGTPSYAGATGVKPVGTSVAGTFKPVAGAPSQASTFSAPAKPVNSQMAGMPTGVTTPAAPKPQLSARAQALKAGGPQGGARERMLRQDLDLFDIVKGYLIDEGYAETEEAAAVIMANMSDEWRQSIVEGSGVMNKPAAPVKTTVDGSATGKPAPQTSGGLTPMQRLQRRPDITIR